MELTTIGREHHPNRQQPMWYTSNDSVTEDLAKNKRFRILFIEDGTGLLNVNGLAFPIEAPAIYCFNEKDSCTMMAGQVKAMSVYFHPSVLNDKFDLNEHLYQLTNVSYSDQQDVWCLTPFVDRSEEYYGAIPIPLHLSKYVSQLFQDIGTVLVDQPDPYWPCKSRSFLHELLYLLARIYRTQDRTELIQQKTPVHSDEFEKVEPILQYLHAHYHEKIKVEDLTKLFHTNKTTLNQRLKEYTGYTTITYLTYIRIQAACSMLRSSTVAITEILNKVGFQDDAHFIRSFRKYTGFSPAEYRSYYMEK